MAALAHMAATAPLLSHMHSLPRIPPLRVVIPGSSRSRTSHLHRSPLPSPIARHERVFLHQVIPSHERRPPAPLPLGAPFVAWPPLQRHPDHPRSDNSCEDKPRLPLVLPSMPFSTVPLLLPPPPPRLGSSGISPSILCACSYLSRPAPILRTSPPSLKLTPCMFPFCPVSILATAHRRNSTGKRPPPSPASQIGRACQHICSVCPHPFKRVLQLLLSATKLMPSSSRHLRRRPPITSLLSEDFCTTALQNCSPAPTTSSPWPLCGSSMLAWQERPYHRWPQRLYRHGRARVSARGVESRGVVASIGPNWSRPCPLAGPRLVQAGSAVPGQAAYGHELGRLASLSPQCIYNFFSPLFISRFDLNSQIRIKLNSCPKFMKLVPLSF
jgi:hypothetical protein